MEKLLSPHRFDHSVFTRRKIISKVFTNFFKIPCILLPERQITLQSSGHRSVRLCNCFYNCGEIPQNVPVRCLFERLWKINSFKDKHILKSTSRCLLLKSVISFQLVQVFSFFIFNKAATKFYLVRFSSTGMVLI